MGGTLISLLAGGSGLGGLNSLPTLLLCRPLEHEITRLTGEKNDRALQSHSCENSLRQALITAPPPTPPHLHFPYSYHSELSSR